MHLGSATVAIGSQGPDVRELQLALISKGYNPGPVDGQFGPQTYQAVVEFQASNRLNQDGIVGPLTWAALQAIRSSAPPAPTPTIATPPLVQKWLTPGVPLTTGDWQTMMPWVLGIAVVGLMIFSRRR